MKKNIIYAALVCTLGLSCVFGIHWSGNAVDKNMQVAISKLNAIDGIEASVATKESSFTSRDHEITVNIGSEEITVSQQVSLYPFGARAVLELHFDEKEMASFREATGLDSLPVAFSWSANGLTDSLNSRFAIVPFNLIDHSEFETFNIKALNLDLESDLDISKMSAVLAWDGLTIKSKRLFFNIDSMMMETEGKKVDGVFLTTLFKGMVRNLNHTEQSYYGWEKKFVLDNLDFNSVGGVEDNGLNGDLTVGAEKMTYTVRSRGFVMDNPLIAVGYSGLSWDAYKQAQEWARSESDDADMFLLAANLLEQGFKFSISDIKSDIKLMNPGENAAGSFSTSGSIEFGNAPAEAVQEPKLLFGFINGELNMKASRSLLEPIVPKGQLEFMKNSGYYKEEGDFLTTVVALKEKQLTINGTEVDLF